MKTLFENYLYEIISQNEIINEDIRYEITANSISRTQDAWEVQSPSLSSKYTIEEFYDLLKKYHDFKKNKVIMNDKIINNVNDFIDVIKKRTGNKTINRGTNMGNITTRQFFLVRFTPAFGKNSKTYEALKLLEDYTKRSMFNPKNLIDYINSKYGSALQTPHGPITDKNIFGGEYINFTINTLQTRFFLNINDFTDFLNFIENEFKNKNFSKNIQIVKKAFISAKEEAGTININYADNIISIFNIKNKIKK